MIADAMWISNVPDGWRPIAFKRAIKRMATGLNPRDNFDLNPQNGDDFYYVTIKNFKNGKVFLDDKCDRIDASAWAMIQNRSDLHKGDILFASISDEGNVYVLEEEPDNWNINESVFCIRVDENWFLPHFFAYMISNQMYYNDLRSDATGTTFLSIKQNKLKDSIILAPPLHEQEKIVAYLDSKCAAIDEAIDRHKKIIEKLNMFLTETIANATLHGISNPEMKPSGVEWITQIPESWDIKRGKYLFAETNRRSVDGNEELLTVSQYTGITPRSQKNVNMFEAESLVGYKICEVNDIPANTMWLWAGAIGVSSYRGLISPSYNIYRQIDNQYDNVYLDYLLRATPLVQHYKALSTGIRPSRLRLYPDQFLNIKFPIPPMVEQKAIARFLDEVKRKVEESISRQTSAIDKLEEYRKSIIYQAVTGKIDCGKEAV